MNTVNTIDEYIAQFPKDVQAILEKIRQTISDVSPEAVETIGYGIPTFKMNGKNLVHFGAYEHHIGFYPTPPVIEAFQEKLKQYKQAKGSVQFPLDQNIPYDLITEMTKYRIKQFS